MLTIHTEKKMAQKKKSVFLILFPLAMKEAWEKNIIVNLRGTRVDYSSTWKKS